MRILVSGDRGYIGSVLVPMLIKKGYEVVGLDCGFFSDNLLSSYDIPYSKITKDIRDVSLDDLKGIDGIIHLAGLSNDPLGEFSPKLTEDINFNGTVRLAELAKKSKVKRFVYSSSQSMYGISDTDKELDEDKSKKNPVTAYAIAKWNAELYLHKIASNDFVVTSMRPSTVFGVSPRLRCDIVFNNLLACAYTTGKIEIMSDGTPWRPIVHIEDVSNALIAGLEAPSEIVNSRAFNVGVPNGNFTVKDIAEAAQKAVPGCELIFTGEHTDPRTYRVAFNRILTELKGYYEPKWNLEMGGREMKDYFQSINFQEAQFRGRETIRLQQLKYLSDNSFLDSTFRLINSNER